MTTTDLQPLETQHDKREETLQRPKLEPEMSKHYRTCPLRIPARSLELDPKRLDIFGKRAG
ncbi:hypothetical protein M407DRAFT_243162, partial [Tulasnella calospora MUT 4182]